MGLLELPDMKHLGLIFVIFYLLSPLSCSKQEKPQVFFMNLKNGETVKNPVLIQFGLKGMELAPAGIQKQNSGHHHLLVDVAALPPMDRPIPADEHHLHFGSGQAGAILKLAPGEHTLQLLMGDHQHIPHNPPVISKRIRIHVVE